MDMASFSANEGLNNVWMSIVFRLNSFTSLFGEGIQLKQASVDWVSKQGDQMSLWKKSQRCNPTHFSAKIDT
jgi:hypothetical protein